VSYVLPLWISKCSAIVLEFNPLPQTNIRNLIQFGLCIEFNHIYPTLSNYFKRNKNISYERYLFRKTKQGETEITDNFIVRLSKLAVSCEFAGDQKNDMIRDQIILHRHFIPLLA
jgi:hypothetical protein